MNVSAVCGDELSLFANKSLNKIELNQKGNK